MKQKNNVYAVIAMVVIVIGVVLAALFIQNNTTLTYEKKSQQDDTVHEEALSFSLIASRDAMRYTYYDLATIKDNPDFGPIVRAVQETYTSPTKDFVLVQNQDEQARANNSSEQNASLQHMLLALSAQDPFYAHIDIKLRIAQGYYFLHATQSMQPGHFQGEENIVRYIFIMDEQQAQRSFTKEYEKQFNSQYNNLTVTKSGVSNGWFVFIVDMPTLLAQRVFIQQGGLR